MAKVIALLIGVCKYPLHSGKDLPFCKNDVAEVRNALISGLSVMPENIMICGTDGVVHIAEVIDRLNDVKQAVTLDDTIIVYFSGHGMNDDKHYLVVSDGRISTQDFIGELEGISAKNKVLFLDCCMAGNFAIDKSAVFDIQKTVDEFASRGYAVFAACGATQFSQKHPRKDISAYTDLLCKAITARSIIREGRKSLYDINELLNVLVSRWNEKHPGQEQTSIYRANLGGTIYFDVEAYQPYVPDTFSYDCDTYQICSVEPSHTSSEKRFSVKAILKQPLSISGVSRVCHEIVNKVRWQNIASTQRMQNYWYGKAANIVFCNFAMDEDDIQNSNYAFRTIWVDETQNKQHWYSPNKNAEVIDDIWVCQNPSYDTMKRFSAEHTEASETLIPKTKAILGEMITLAEKVIFEFNEYCNGIGSEDLFKNNTAETMKRIHALFLEESDLNIAANDLKEWSQCCDNLAGNIHEFTLFYAQNAYARRTPENRKKCMELAVARYYKNLEEFRQIDATI